MSAFYLLEKYEPPKNQAPSKVRRFQLYRRPVSKPTPTRPPAKLPRQATPALPTPQWSDWKFIKEPQWEGYWRASAQEDGGWCYHFTKDGKTIWEQRLPKPEAPKPCTASANNDAIVKPSPPFACKQAQWQTTAKISTTTVTATKLVPSCAVKKQGSPKPSASPKKVNGTITLHTKSGKAVTVPLPDPGKPLVIRTLLEN